MWIHDVQWRNNVPFVERLHNKLNIYYKIIYCDVCIIINIKKISKIKSYD